MPTDPVTSPIFPCMVPFRHVVVGVELAPDGGLGPGSRAAIAHVRWLAEGATVRCSLVHSEAPDEVWDPGSGQYELMSESPREPLEGALSELRDAGIEADLSVTEEKTALAIQRRVVGDPCDLVLVGKRACSDPDGPRVGSTATQLLRTCPCPVWAVRPDATPPPRCILAAADLDPVGTQVIQRAGELATLAGADLHAVRAVQLSMAAQLGAGDSEESLLERERQRTDEAIRRVLADTGFEGEVQIHTGLTSPTRAVLACVGRFQPDLVVMGTISRGGIAGLLVGNTAERLFSRLEVSLLTVKPADFVSPLRLED